MLTYAGPAWIILMTWIFAMHTYKKLMVGLCNEIFQDRNRTANVVYIRIT